MKPIIAAGAMALAVAAVGARQAIPQATGPNVARDLRGAIDIHVHSDPDKVPRVARRTRSGAAGERAKAARDCAEESLRSDRGSRVAGAQATPGIEVFGGIDLNLPVGGMNVHAVEHMAQANGGFGRVVWMSTFDSENQVRAGQGRPSIRPCLAEWRAAA